MQEMPDYDSGYFWTFLYIGVPSLIIVFIVVWVLMCMCDFDKLTQFEKNRI
jgi:fatty acid desaturase